MVDFDQEKRWWDHKAPKEEQDREDEAVNRALRWREIDRRLDGVTTLLEIGGATGAFSIPLARRGYQVTHFDLSPGMLAIARQKAQGLETIRFVEGNAVDLSRFADASFDLVLAMDGAISFSGAQAERALAETCRVTKRRLLVTVSHRAHLLPSWLEASVTVLGAISGAVYEMLNNGTWRQEQFAENALLSKGATDDYMGPLKAFLPGELSGLLRQNGLRVLRCGGLGSLASQVKPETIRKVLADPVLFDHFVDLCEVYDRELLPDGPGTQQRAGLIAVAERDGPNLWL